ncbi:amidohydrolase family protein [Christiangramia crocea]|nr:amidohydrolase family protein [Gramella crocea]
MEDYQYVKKFDSHIHINTYDTYFIDLVKKDNFKFLNIVDDRPFGLPMEEQEKVAISHFEDFSDQMIFATTFSVDDWENDNWLSKTISHLENSFSKGAKAVKIWKNIGMDLRDAKGNFVMVDNPRLDLILDFLSKKNIAVIGHNGEPRDCWLPLDEMTFSQNYYGSHPEYHMYLHPEFPSYWDQINARDNMLNKHPELKFIGAHLGSMEWNLEELAKRLDKYPNMDVDLSRISNLQLHTIRNREKTRNFFIKYQDRLIYATDTSINSSENPEKIKNKIHNNWIEDWRFFATDHKMNLKGHGSFRGLKLPKKVIDKIYFKNAQKKLGFS